MLYIEFIKRTSRSITAATVIVDKVRCPLEGEINRLCEFIYECT
jgi:hypothetical protein